MSEYRDLPRPGTPGPWRFDWSGGCATINLTACRWVHLLPEHHLDAEAIAALPDWIKRADELMAQCVRNDETWLEVGQLLREIGLLEEGAEYLPAVKRAIELARLMLATGDAA